MALSPYIVFALDKLMTVTYQLPINYFSSVQEKRAEKDRQFCVIALV
jgi:hypothetical protein